MNKIIIITAIILLFVILSGCDGIITSETDCFVGTWEEKDGDIYTFFSDGSASATVNYTGVILTSSGTYELKDGKFVLSLYWLDLGGEAIYNYFFSNRNNSLTLINIGTGNELILNKI